MTTGLPGTGAAPGIVAIVLVTVATLALGAYGLRLSRTTSDFMVASRAVGPRMNAAAVSGEYLSAASFLGAAGLLLAFGAEMLWYPVGWTAGYLVLLVLVAAPLRRSGAYTLPDFAEARLGSRAVRRTCALLVVAIGWLYLLPQFQGAGITLANGVRTDEGMVCDLPNVVAVGDVARYSAGGGDHRHEHWTSAGEQADVAAVNLLAGRTLATVRPSGYFWSEQYGRMLQLAGHPGRTDRVELVDGDVSDRVFTARYVDAAGTTTAVVGLGSPRAFGRLRRSELGRARQPA